MKRIIISLAAMVLLLLCASPAFGASAILDEIKMLRASDKQSNDLITHSVIDLVYVPEGTVTTYTYVGNDEALTVNQFTGIAPQTPKSASQLITSFVFDLTNQYRPETEIAMRAAGPDDTVHTYTYGERKDHAMLSIISGLPDCLGNPPVHRDSKSSSWTSKYSPEEMPKEPVTSFVVTQFALDQQTYTMTDSDGNADIRTMDVEPEIVNARIFAPVRYVAYAVGVDPNDVGWDSATKTVALAKDDTEIRLVLQSDMLSINDEFVPMDAAPYIKQGRTMLPPRWVAEAFGAQVAWDAENQKAIITLETEVEIEPTD